jgi:hypothetical protein
METWKHGNMETWSLGDMETWKHGDIAMEFGRFKKNKTENRSPGDFP